MYKFRQRDQDPAWFSGVYGLAPSQYYPRGERGQRGMIDAAKAMACPGPAWRINKQTQLLMAGSCFAYHIANALRDRGYNVPAQYDLLFTMQGCTYTLHLLRDEIARALGHRTAPPVDAPIWRVEDGDKEHWVDGLYLRRACSTFDEAVEQRANYREQLARQLRESQVIVWTLGQTETPFYTGPGGSCAVGTVPPPTVWINPDQRGHYSVRRVRYSEAGDQLYQAFHMVKAVNSAARFIVTVSPVPLRATFCLPSAIVAAEGSKAILRAVAEQFVHSQPACTSYFPSFEYARIVRAGSAYKADNRHIHAEVRSEIITLFEDVYCERAESAAASTA